MSYSLRCPWSIIDSEISHYFDLYFLFEKGFLLVEGAVADQPLWYTRMMALIDGEVKKSEKARIETERKKRSNESKII